MKKLILNYINTSFIFLVVQIANVATQDFESIKNDSVKCPIGFTYLRSTNLCYEVKRFELYSEKYEKCSGNEVALDFRGEYMELFANYTINVFWMDYVRMYDGGPFMNWRYEDPSMGKPSNVTIISNNTFHGCVFIEISTGILKSDYCNNTHARLCVIKPYSDAYPFFWDCPSGYTSFPAPVPTCLIVREVSPPTPRRVSLRATWQQVSLMCNNSQGNLPQRGYVYLNHEEFMNVSIQVIPLGIIASQSSVRWIHPYGDDIAEVSIYEQRFENSNALEASSGIVSLWREKWHVNENNVVYHNAVCESFVSLPAVDINIFQPGQTRDEKLYVNTSEDIRNDDLWCFTDSYTYYPVKLNIYPVLKNYNRTYFLQTMGNGYYWCLLVNTREYLPRKSGKYLYIKDPDELGNVYAIRIRFYRNIGFSEYLIKEYLRSFFSNYNLVFGDNESEVISRLQDEDKRLRQHLAEASPLLFNVTVKAIYHEEKSVLIHASYINKFLINYRLYKYFHFDYVRNVKYCFPHGNFNESVIGDYIDVLSECKRYICSGNFNEGAYWWPVDLDNCTSTNTTTTDVPTITDPTTTEETTTVTEVITTTTPSYVNTTRRTTTLAPPLNPDEEIDNVLTIIDDILSGPVINSTQLNEAIVAISDLFQSVDNKTFPTAILQGIERMLNKVDLPEGHQDLMIVRPHLAVVVADKSRNSLISGIKLSSSGKDSLGNDSLHLLSDDDYVTNDEENDIVVRVPVVNNNAQGRLIFTVFKDDKPFSQNETKVNSRVLSVSVNGMDIFEENRYLDMHFRPQTNINKNESKVCGYWKFQNDSSGNKGMWSTDGCRLLVGAGPGGLDTCRCTHLTHFAQLIVGSNNYFTGMHYNVLTIISITGCVMSLVGFMIIALTGILFRSWRSDFSNKIWLHLSAAMTLMIFTFLLIAFSNLQQQKEVSCIITGVLLHYSVLASFGWMFISAVLSYQRLVTVFTKCSSHKLLKASICGWIIPFVPIGILFIFDPSNYSQHFAIEDLPNTICYPSGLGLWLTVYLPIALIVTVNTLLFIMIVYSVFINSKIKRHGDNGHLFRSITVSFLLFSLFGLTWIFGLFGRDIVMAYLFCITATGQGLVLCLFFVIGNKKTRELWLVQLRIREKGKIPVTSSLSRSYPSRGNSKSGKAVSIKRNDDDLPTKPRSLSVIDKSNLRFS